MKRRNTNRQTGGIDSGAAASAALEPRPIDVGEHEFDPVLGVTTLFVEIPRVETVYFRLAVESWEDYGVARTIERFRGPDRRQTLIVVMVAPDYVGPASRSLARLLAEVDGRQVASTDALREVLRRDLVG